MFRVYEIIIAIICIGMPVILRVYDKDVVYPVKVNFLKSGVIKDSSTSIVADVNKAQVRKEVRRMTRNQCDCDSVPAVTSSGDSVQVIDKDRWCFRTSISDYAYSTNSYLFGMLLCIAAMLFLFNGAVYFKTSKRFDAIKDQGNWYNVVLGLSLLGVICCPHRDWPTLHYFFAIIFFFGNALVIGVFHNRKDKIKSIVMAILAGGFLLLTLFHIEGFTVFWGEWCSLAVIGIHFIMEARRAQV